MDSTSRHQVDDREDEGDEADELPAGSVSMAILLQGSKMGAAWFDPCTSTVRQPVVP